MLEVYNEIIRDLLSSKPQEEHKVKKLKKKKKKNNNKKKKQGGKQRFGCVEFGVSRFLFPPHRCCLNNPQVSDGSGMSEVPTATKVVVDNVDTVLDLITKGMGARVEVSESNIFESENRERMA